MMNADTLRARMDGLREQIEATYRVKGRDLKQSYRRSRHLLPRSVRRSLRDLVEAGGMLGHPKLERLVDFPKLSKDADWVETHLGSIDVGEQRRTRIINFVAVLAFNLLLVTVGFVLWMVWTGQL